VLLEEFLKPMGISAGRLSKKDIGISPIRFGLKNGFRTGLQLDHDAAITREKIAGELPKIKLLKAA
jgi:hypothetical protein